MSTYGSTGAVSSERRTEGAEELRSSATDSRETNEISESFIPSAARGESIDAAEIQSTAFTSWNFTGGDGDASDGMLNDVSSTTVVSSPVGRIDTAGTVEPFVTGSSGAITFSSVSAGTGRSTETSDNYLNNGAVDGGSLQTDEPATPRTEEEINGDRGISFQEEVQSTTVDSKGDRSTENDFILGSSGSHFMEGSTADRSVEGKLASEVVARGDAIDDFDEAVELVNTSSIVMSSLAPDTSRFTSVEYQASTTGGVEEEETEGSTLTTTAFVEKDIKKTVGRGDSPILDDSMDAEDEEGNMVAGEGESNFTTVVREPAGSSFSEFANTSSAEIPEVKIATESSREISENHVAGSAETFSPNQRANVFQVSKKTPWSLPSSTIYPSKIGKASISRKPPLDNEFWKYTVTSRSVTSAVATSRSTWKLPDRPQVRNGLTRGSVKSKKRGSLNTNVEKNFRWFYNFGREDKERAR